MIRVLIADRNCLVRDLLALACRKRGMDVVAEVSTAEELVIASAETRPDIALVSDPLAGRRVAPIVKALATKGIRVVVLSDESSSDRIEEILAAGACGYLMHDVKASDIAEALLGVAQGGGALNRRAAGLILNQWRTLRSAGSPVGASLTRRERDVLEAMADGLGTKTIARRLGVAMKTVENHKLRVFDKLGARTQAHAVSIAMAHGLVVDLRTPPPAMVPEDEDPLSRRLVGIARAD